MTSTQTNLQIPAPIDAATLKRWLHDGQEIALLDVREHGQYGEAHPFFSTTLPYSRLEIDAPRLVPRQSARIVLLDDGDDVAARAARVLRGMGYSDARPLQGGFPAWKAAGYGVFAGVNLPSKTFGEIAEHVLHTPRISATDLAGRLQRGDNLVVLDGRPFGEYGKMNIPGSICCPNGELALRAQELAPRPDTTIVINCAGRTRSIIGAQTLIDLGVPNPVYALENGTQGWYLADLQLEHGAQRKYPETVSQQTLPVLRERARKLADKLGVRSADAAQVRAWQDEAGRSTYLCDVRTPEEYAAGTLSGAQHTPGGQLIQATDQFVGLRGARLVVFDNEGVRALVVAGWLHRMGWDVYVLDGDLKAGMSAPRQPALPRGPEGIESSAIGAAVREGAVLVDVRPGMNYREAHLQGARWSIRPRLHQLGLDANAQVILLAAEAGVGALAARELAELGVTRVRINCDKPAAWRSAGLAVEASPETPSDADCIDYLFFVHDRHDGNKAAARQYIAWETNLVNQIDAEERASFRLPQAGEAD